MAGCSLSHPRANTSEMQPLTRPGELLGPMTRARIASQKPQTRSRTRAATVHTTEARHANANTTALWSENERRVVHNTYRRLAKKGEEPTNAQVYHAYAKYLRHRGRTPRSLHAVANVLFHRRQIYNSANLMQREIKWRSEMIAKATELSASQISLRRGRPRFAKLAALLNALGATRNPPWPLVGAAELHLMMAQWRGRDTLSAVGPRRTAKTTEHSRYAAALSKNVSGTTGLLEYEASVTTSAPCSFGSQNASRTVVQALIDRSRLEHAANVAAIDASRRLIALLSDEALGLERELAAATAQGSRDDGVDHNAAMRP